MCGQQSDFNVPFQSAISIPSNKKPKIGVRRWSTKDSITLVKALPIMRATARSSSCPLAANSRTTVNIMWTGRRAFDYWFLLIKRELNKKVYTRRKRFISNI